MGGAPWVVGRGSTSMSTGTQALRNQRLVVRGDVVTEDDPTSNTNVILFVTRS